MTYDELTADWPTYYGIKLNDAGEDGDVVVIGHHGDDRRVVAALNRHARTVWGAPLGDDYESAAMNLAPRWARFMTTCEDAQGHQERAETYGRCWRCAEIEQGDWWMKWDVKPTDEGAFPITHWGGA